jgi:hypothetical protein
MVIPDVLQQHGAGDHWPARSEIFEQAKLARLKHDLLPALRDLMGEPVERKVPTR